MCQRSRTAAAGGEANLRAGMADLKATPTSRIVPALGAFAALVRLVP
jgi:hypothetical protein